MYKNIIKPILFMFPPDIVHKVIALTGRVVQGLPPARWLVEKMWRCDDNKLSQSFLGVDFANPVGLSAGFDKNIQLVPLMESVGFGFETAGSVTFEERAGNVRPWFYRLPKTNSIVVHAGLANQGIVTMYSSIKRQQKIAMRIPLSISVAVVGRTSNSTTEEAIEAAVKTIEYILQHKLSKMIEINISCPNAGDSQPFSRPEILEQLLSRLDKIDRTIPFLVKMPNLFDEKIFDQLLDIVAVHNIQGLTIANLVKDRDMIEVKDYLPNNIKGGLSGEPTRDNSTKLISRAYERYGDKLLIIGVGGIFSAKHAYEKIRAGASLVAMITGVIFEGPQVVGRINRGLVELLESDDFSTISEAIGADHKKSS